MTSHGSVQPVPAADYPRAMRFLAGGRRDDPRVRARAEGFRQTAHSAGDRARLWWAFRGRHVRAVAMVLDTPGRASLLYYSPPTAPGVGKSALAGLVEAISRDAIDRGAAFVQAAVHPSATKDIRMLTEAGLSHLADLVDMRLDFDLSVPAPPAEPPAWRWHPYEQITEAQLAEVVLATYERSLDCPRLRGLRTGEQVLAGHRATGVFCPAGWCIAYAPDGTPAGCLLVNDVADERASNVVYLGVVPACRGQGLAAAMLRRAESVARARDKLAITLAVDTRNTYAHSVYLRAGFVQVAERSVYAACAPAKNAPRASERRSKTPCG